MTFKGWKGLLENFINKKDKETFELLNIILFEQDKAKQELRNKGYGWTGLSLLETVQNEVPSFGDIRNEI